MIVGAIEIDFILHDCHSLKDKRSVVKRIIDRTKNRFRVSVAEVDCLDLRNRGRIGVAVVSNDKRHANSILSQVSDFIENLCLVDITKIDMFFF